MIHLYTRSLRSNLCCLYRTHDNDTIVGWFNSVPGVNSTRSETEIASEKANALNYFGTDGSEPIDCICRLYASEAAATIIPLQDLLGLGSEAYEHSPAGFRKLGLAPSNPTISCRH